MDAAAAPNAAAAAPNNTNTSTSKAKRYDRQVRVWGPEGQARLENARVALLGAGPAGTETLKNLVLAGIAAFTVVDGGSVSRRDLGNNWLCSREHLGQSRARCVAALLGELNEEARGSYVEDDPEALLRREPAFVTGPAAAAGGGDDNAGGGSDGAAAAASAHHHHHHHARPRTAQHHVRFPSPPFDLVVASGLREPALLRLDALCRAAKIPLVAVRCYGLGGTVRLSLADPLGVWDSRPDSIVDDLRVCEPWPELLAHCEAVAGEKALREMDDHAHRHAPFAAVLVAAAGAWRAERGGMPPSTAEERAEFKARLAALRRRAPEDQGGAPLEEENFDEALRAAFHAWTPARVPAEAAAVLADPLASDPPPPPTAGGDAADAAANPNNTNADPNFWVLVAALRAFVEHEGGGTRPPLEGSLPDMASTTAAYVALQRCYRDKAVADAAAVAAHAKSVLRKLGRDENEVSAEEVRRACRHARHVRVVRFKSLAEEWHGARGAAAAEAAAMAAGEEDGGGGGGGGAGVVNGGGGGAAAAAAHATAGGSGGSGAAGGGLPSGGAGGGPDRAGSTGSVGAAMAAAAGAGGGGGGGGAGGCHASSTHPTTSEGEALAAALADEGTNARSASLYVLLRAADAFYAAHGRWPGAPPPESPASSPPDPAAAAAAAAAALSGPAGAPYEEDVPVLRSLAQQLLADLGVGSSASASAPASATSAAVVDGDYVAEVVRWGAAELHSVAAVVGGVASQEATKVLTRAFVPVASTLVYDAVACTTWSLGGA
jgi:amyloid beta precursor protein binding protein 1